MDAPKDKPTVDKTVGEISQSLLTQDTVSVGEQTDAMLSDFDKDFNESINNGIEAFDGVFYICILHKRERILKNVIRNYFVVRETCPTPNYDQSVYRIDPKACEIKFIWAVPNIRTAQRYRDHPETVDLDKVDLFKCVQAYYDGRLLHWCKLLNGEIKESTAATNINESKLSGENLIIQS